MNVPITSDLAGYTAFWDGIAAAVQHATSRLEVLLVIVAVALSAIAAGLFVIARRLADVVGLLQRESDTDKR